MVKAEEAQKPYIDAHCHLADPRFDHCREAVITRALQAGVGYFIQGGVGPEDWRRQCELQGRGILKSFGLHPWWVAERSEAECEGAMTLLEAMLPQAFALGELGLDFLPRFAPPSFTKQRRYFIRQLELAAKSAKPIVLHIVRAHGEAPDIIRKAGVFKGIVHGFSGSWEVARQYLDLGLLISIGPGATREGYGKLKKAISRLPISQIIIESDAPDMAPAGFQHPLNEPASIHCTAEAVGALKGMSAEQVLERSRENLAAYFNLELA